MAASNRPIFVRRPATAGVHLFRTREAMLPVDTDHELLVKQGQIVKSFFRPSQKAKYLAQLIRTSEVT
jgi:hypothetical protein